MPSTCVSCGALGQGKVRACVSYTGHQVSRDGGAWLSWVAPFDATLCAPCGRHGADHALAGGAEGLVDAPELVLWQFGDQLGDDLLRMPAEARRKKSGLFDCDGVCVPLLFVRYFVRAGVKGSSTSRSHSLRALFLLKKSAEKFQSEYKFVKNKYVGMGSK